MQIGLHRWGIAFLALWLAASCAAGCLAESRPGGHSPAAAPAGESESCADGCCQQDAGEEPHPDHSGDAMECCLFLAAPPTTLGKKFDSAPALSAVPDSAPALALTLHHVPARAPFLPGDSGIFLRCRVLRI